MAGPWGLPAPSGRGQDQSDQQQISSQKSEKKKIGCKLVHVYAHIFKLAVTKGLLLTHYTTAHLLLCTYYNGRNNGHSNLYSSSH